MYGDLTIGAKTLLLYEKATYHIPLKQVKYVISSIGINQYWF